MNDDRTSCDGIFTSCWAWFWGSSASWASRWRAIRPYENKHGRRPKRLETLVTGKLIGARDLFDEQTKDIPAIDARTGRIDCSPQVLYFPAVRKTCPPDLVLRCTLLLHQPGDLFPVVHNDGRYAEMTSHELIGLLQKTYTYLGR